MNSWILLSLILSYGDTDDSCKCLYGETILGIHSCLHKKNQDNTSKLILYCTQQTQIVSTVFCVCNVSPVIFHAALKRVIGESVGFRFHLESFYPERAFGLSGSNRALLNPSAPWGARWG